MSDDPRSPRLSLDRLRVRCARAADESVRGFRLRVAELNGYSIAEMPPDLDPLAPREIAKSSWGRPDVAGTRLSRRNVDAVVPKVCPACVAVRHYIPAVWELSLWTACPLHGCRMMCECQECGRRLSWSRTRLDRCCDDAPFGRFETGPAPKATVQLLRRFAAVLGFPTPAASDPGIVAETELLSALDMCNLIWLLGRLEDNRTSIDNLPLAAAAKVVETAASVLSGWPDAFHEALERVYVARGESVVSMERSLGPLFRRIYAERSASNYRSGNLRFVYDEFRRFNGRRNGWVHSRSYLPDSAAMSGPAALGEISRSLGVNWRSALRIVEEGTISSLQRSFGRKKTLIVNAAEFIDAARRNGLTAECRRLAGETGAIGSRQVEELLGVSAAMVRQLQVEGLLGEPVPLAFTTLFSGDSVRRLLARLEDLAASAPRLSGIRSATEGNRRKITRMKFEDYTAAECLRAVLERGVVPVAVIDGETGLNRFSFERAEVRRYLDAQGSRQPAVSQSPP